MNREINVNGALIRFIDLENEFTFEMEPKGRELYKEFTKKALESQSKLKELLDNIESLKQTEKDVNIKDIDVVMMNENISQLSQINVDNLYKMYDANWIIDVLALITTIKDVEPDFDNYENMRKIWKKANRKMLKDVFSFIGEFISFFSISTTEDLRIFQNEKTTEKQQQKNNTKTQKKTD